MGFQPGLDGEKRMIDGYRFRCPVVSSSMFQNSLGPRMPGRKYEREGRKAIREDVAGYQRTLHEIRALAGGR